MMTDDDKIMRRMGLDLVHGVEGLGLTNEKELSWSGEILGYRVTIDLGRDGKPDFSIAVAIVITK